MASATASSAAPTTIGTSDATTTAGAQRCARAASGASIAGHRVGGPARASHTARIQTSTRCPWCRLKPNTNRAKKPTKPAVPTTNSTSDESRRIATSSPNVTAVTESSTSRPSTGREPGSNSQSFHLTVPSATLITGVNARSGMVSAAPTDHAEAPSTVAPSPRYAASAGGITCFATSATTTITASSAAPAAPSCRDENRGRSSAPNSQSVTYAAASASARRSPSTVVFARSTSSTLASTVRRRSAVHAAHDAKASSIPSPYGRTITAYS
jgi:hypothetical protein